MGIRFFCPNGHKLNVKEFQAGRRGVCPYCGVKFRIPRQSTRERARISRGRKGDSDGLEACVPDDGEDDAERPAAERPPGEPSPHPAGSAPAAEATPAPASPPAPEPPPPPVFAEPDGREDPLAVGEDVVWYLRPPSGGQYGPASGTVMREWMDEGRIGSDALVWREGWPDWREAADVFPELAKPAALFTPIIDSGSASDADAHSAGPAKRPRRRSKDDQTLLIFLLIMAVVLLVGVFVWILASPPTKPAPEEERSEEVSRVVPSSNAFLAVTAARAGIRTSASCGRVAARAAMAVRFAGSRPAKWGSCFHIVPESIPQHPTQARA